LFDGGIGTGKAFSSDTRGRAMLVVWCDFFAASMLARSIGADECPQRKTDERDDDQDGIRLSGFMGVLLWIIKPMIELDRGAKIIAITRIILTKALTRRP
jgi:hypothetical protein